MDYFISDISSLHKLKREKDLKYSIRKIKLDINDSIQSKMYERKLNKYYFACGCREGAIGVYFSLFCCFVTSWRSDSMLITGWWKIVAIVAVSALSGKIVGLLLSNLKLKKVLRDLERYIISAPKD